MVSNLSTLVFPSVNIKNDRLSLQLYFMPDFISSRNRLFKYIVNQNGRARVCQGCSAMQTHVQQRTEGKIRINCYCHA